MTNVKGKPPPRKPVDPTFRGWKEVGGFEADDALTAADETVDLLSRGPFSINTYQLSPTVIGITTQPF